MECRCPGCHQPIVWEGRMDSRSYISCHNCDRGFHPQDALCNVCGHQNPFSRRDQLAYVCNSCGTTQPDYGARLTA